MKPFLAQLKSLWASVQRVPWIHFLLEISNRFGKNNGGLMAAGLAFFMVLAFVPLLLVGLWVLGHVYASRPDEAVQKIHALLSTQVVPGAAGDEVTHLMERAGIASQDDANVLHAGKTLLDILHKRGLAGLLGVGGLIWAAIQIFINGSVAMNAAWDTTEKRGWIKLRLVALGLLVAAGVLIVLSLAATGLGARLSGSEYANLFPHEALLRTFLFEIGAVVVSAVMYGIIYKFLPSAPVSWKAALVGGAFAALAWEVAKRGLAVYLLHPNKSLYGELGNLIIFILWVYYSMMILLLGAEASATYGQDIEGAKLSRLKRHALSHPANAAVSSSGSPLSRAKDNNRARRIRRTAPGSDEQARRR